MKADDTAEWRHVLATKGWLSLQTELFRETILREGRAVSVNRGKPVYLPGDDRGGIGIHISAGRHVPRLVHIARAGRWFTSRLSPCGA